MFATLRPKIEILVDGFAVRQDLACVHTRTQTLTQIVASTRAITPASLPRSTMMSICGVLSRLIFRERTALCHVAVLI